MSVMVASVVVVCLTCFVVLIVFATTQACASGTYTHQTGSNSCIVRLMSLSLCAFTSCAVEGLHMWARVCNVDARCVCLMWACVALFHFGHFSCRRVSACLFLCRPGLMCFGFFLFPFWSLPSRGDQLRLCVVPCGLTALRSSGVV